jgi:hypothetical protein
MGKADARLPGRVFSLIKHVECLADLLNHRGALAQKTLEVDAGQKLAEVFLFALSILDELVDEGLGVFR